MGLGVGIGVRVRIRVGVGAGVRVGVRVGLGLRLHVMCSLPPRKTHTHNKPTNLYRPQYFWHFTWYVWDGATGKATSFGM